MKIGLNLNKINTYNNTRRRFLSLQPLRKDTVSFSSMKKSQFSGLDLMVINKFKAPIEKFNSNNDFQEWCAKKIKNEIIEKKYKLTKSADIQAKLQKNKILTDWIKYVTVENPTCSYAAQLMILTSITTNLDYNTNHLPANLNKKIFADTLNEITENCKRDKNYNCNFDKLYRNKLLTTTASEYGANNNSAGWIVIPSKLNNSKNFIENAIKLQTLSHERWCTKTYNATPYLAKGDFHIYFEKGKPKLGVRFCGDEIQEIQGEKNNSRIPLNYLTLLKNYVKENNYQLSEYADFEFKKADKLKNEIYKYEQKLKNYGVDFKTCSTEQLFDCLGINYEKNKDGKLILENYNQPSIDLDYDDLGISEDKLLNDIAEIKGSADFRYSNATGLGNVEIIGENANFNGSKINNFGKLKMIGKDAYFSYSKIKDLGSLEYIGGNAEFVESIVKNLGNLKYIGNSANLFKSPVKSLNKLEYIGGNAEFNESKIEDLGNLEYIGGNASFEGSNIKNCKNLKYIGGNADFMCSSVTDTGDLETIKGNADFQYTGIKTCKNLKYVGKDADFGYSKIENLDNLEYVGRNADFSDINIKALDNLKEVGGDIILNPSVKSLKKLKSVGGNIINSSDEAILNSSLEDVKGEIEGVSKEEFNYIKLIRNNFKRKFTIEEIKAIAKENLSIEQIKTFIKYVDFKEIEAEKAAFEASFS